MKQRKTLVLKGSNFFFFLGGGGEGGGGDEVKECLDEKELGTSLFLDCNYLCDFCL